MARTYMVAILAVLSGCGPAPYIIGPEEPPAEAPPPVAVVVASSPVPLLPVLPAPPPVREPPDRWIPDELPLPNPFADQRTWVGAYDCLQGRTSLALRIIDVRGRRVRAIFDFHHAPTDTSGQYLLMGSFDEQSGETTFSPGMWIIHPDGYISVGMKGHISPDGTRFEGWITHPTCGAFRLHAAR